MDHLLPQGEGGEARVVEAMRYSSLGGGKRCARFSCGPENVVQGGWVSSTRTRSAIELCTRYSLIHDDTAAMDD